MARISIKKNAYPDFSKDCKSMAKILLPKLITRHDLIHIDILEQYKVRDPNRPYKKVYGDCRPGFGLINIYLTTIYEFNRSNEFNRVKFIKTLIHECLHLRLGFKITKEGRMVDVEEQKKFNELLELYVDNLAHRKMKDIKEELGINIENPPFNINKDMYKRYVMELEAEWTSKIIQRFISFDMCNKTLLNMIFANTMRQTTDVLLNEMEVYFNRGFGFIDRSDSWKRARDNENKAKLKAERSIETDGVSSKQ